MPAAGGGWELHLQNICRNIVKDYTIGYHSYYVWLNAIYGITIYGYDYYITTPWLIGPRYGIWYMVIVTNHGFHGFPTNRWCYKHPETISKCKSSSLGSRHFQIFAHIRAENTLLAARCASRWQDGRDFTCRKLHRRKKWIT